MPQLLLFVFLFSLSNSLMAKVVHREKSKDYALLVRELYNGFGVPWGFEFIDSETLLVNEKSGKISNLNLTTQKVEPLKLDIPVFETGQGGLLDIKKHPKFPKQPWIYITYVENIDGQAATVLARFQYKKSQASNFTKLLVSQSRTDKGHHFGSRIAFDGKGHLFFTVGDRGVRPNGQNRKTHAGSVLRLNEDGSVPKDNPFVGDKNALAEIWSYGHRNPQGLVYDSKTSRLWEIEHGPRGGDEINLIEKGKNYGWPTISYGKEYSSPAPVGEGTQKPGMEQPVHYYVPSIAPCGMDIYRGSVFKKWDGQLIAGALKLTHLNKVSLNGTQFSKEERLLENFYQRIRQVKVGPDGFIYFSTDTGKILRLEPETNAKESVGG